MEKRFISIMIIFALTITSCTRKAITHKRIQKYHISQNEISELAGDDKVYILMRNREYVKGKIISHNSVSFILRKNKKKVFNIQYEDLRRISNKGSIVRTVADVVILLAATATVTFVIAVNQLNNGFN